MAELQTSTTDAHEPPSVTYVLALNESDLLKLYDEVESTRPLYVHNYVEIVLLAALTVISFGFNAALATASMLQSSLLQTSFRLTLVSLTALHIVDCVFDGAVAITYMTRVVWDFGLFLCQASAFVLHLWLLVLPLTLLHAGLTIALPAKNISLSNKVDRTRRRRHAWIIIAVTWTLVACLILGLLEIPWLEVRPYPARMACTIDPVRPANDVSEWLLPVIVCIVPTISLAVVAVVLLAVLWRDRQLKRRIAHFSTARSNISTNASVNIIEDAARRRLSGHDIRSLFVTWFALLAGYFLGAVPYALNAHCGRMMMTSAEESSPSTSASVRWEVCRTPIMDVFFSWMRLFVPLTHAIVVFALNDDLRQDLLLAVLWWRPSPLTSSAAAAADDADITLKHRAIINAAYHKNNKTFLTDRLRFLRGGANGEVAEVDPATPVLFVSSQGLCLRRPADSARRPGDVEQFVCSFSDLVADCCRRRLPTSHSEPIRGRHDHGAANYSHLGAAHRTKGHQTQHPGDNVLKRRSRSASPVDAHSNRHRQKVTPSTAKFVYNNKTANKQAIVRTTPRERDLKVGIWPQAARFSGPRNDDQLNRSSVNRTGRLGLDQRPASYR